METEDKYQEAIDEFLSLTAEIAVAWILEQDDVKDILFYSDLKDMNS